MIDDVIGRGPLDLLMASHMVGVIMLGLISLISGSLINQPLQPIGGTEQSAFGKQDY